MVMACKVAGRIGVGARSHVREVSRSGINCGDNSVGGLYDKAAKHQISLIRTGTYHYIMLNKATTLLVLRNCVLITTTRRTGALRRANREKWRDYFLEKPSKGHQPSNFIGQPKCVVARYKGAGAWRVNPRPHPDPPPSSSCRTSGGDPSPFSL